MLDRGAVNKLKFEPNGSQIPEIEAAEGCLAVIGEYLDAQVRR